MIYVRTRQGQAEIESATRTLPQRLRMILLLVDGRRTAEALQTMLALATPGTMSELKALGYIAVLRPADQTEPSATTATPAAQASLPRRGTFAAIGRPSAAFATTAHRAAVAREQASAPAPQRRAQAVDTSRDESRFKASQMPSRFEVADHADDEPCTPAQRQPITRSLQRALGPTGAPWVQRVEAATSVRELKRVLHDAHLAIARARGSDMADEFASRYGTLEALP